MRQLELGDCGAACLAMVLRAHGCPVELGDLRDLTSTGREGVSAAGLLAAARHFGFAGTGVRCPPDRLAELPPGAVLYWGGNHFVVLEGHTRRGPRILDPAVGRRLLTHGAARARYSGVALWFDPPADGTGAGAATTVPPPRPSRLAAYRPYFAGVRRPALFALACAVVVQVLTLAHPAVVRYVVSGLGEGAEGTGPATQLALGVVALGVGYLLATAGRLLFLVALQRSLDYRLTLGVLAHLASLPYAFLARRSTGDLTLRLRSTVAVREILTATSLSALLDGALVLVYLALIAAIDGWFALMTAGAIAAQVAVVALTWPRLRHAAAEALEAQASSQAQLLEIVTGLEVLKVSGTADEAVRSWTSRLRREVDTQADRNRLSGVVEGLLLAIRFVAPPALLALGFGRVSAGALSLADMLALATLAAAVTVPTGSLLSTACALTTVGSYLDRLDDLLRSPPERRAGHPPPPRLSGAIRLEDVSYSYSALLPPAVSDVSLEVEPGEFVAIVGESGSGKTTLAMLVATLYEPSAGRVLFDGRDARDYDAVGLRRRLGVVTQQTTLFGTSVRDNIAFGRDWLTDDDIVAAARLAQIDADVEALPSGYSTRLGNAGSGLSGGQRQRLALARALAGSPGVLVLDEATSALDSMTEAAVHAALAELRCTRIVVAHRMSTVAGADRIVVLKEGRVVASGSYAQVRRRSPEFRALVGAGTPKPRTSRPPSP